MFFSSSRPFTWGAIRVLAFISIAGFGLAACTKDHMKMGDSDAAFSNTAPEEASYSEEEVRLAADNLFGKAAESTGRLVESIFKRYGRPTAYIVGQELSAAVIAGGRVGKGTLHHKLEGIKPIKWLGPSIGFDFGMNGGETFQLVYNLYDPETLFRWRPGGEGNAYMMGGFNVSYQESDDIAIVTIKFGVGMRLGVNLGYNKYSPREADLDTDGGTS